MTVAGDQALVRPSRRRAPEPAVARAEAAVRRSGSLERASIGIVPIVWNNADLPDLAPLMAANVVLDEIARLGYEGLQEGTGFPRGRELESTLSRRGLRLAEVYAGLPCATDGPTPDTLDIGRQRLADLHEAGGEVLVVALGFSPGRVERAGRAGTKGTPSLTKAGWRKLTATLEALALDAQALGHRLAFHNHAGTLVETPGELDQLVARTDPDLVGLCLDVGHFILGGGDPVAAIRRYDDRVVHVHLKDVAPEPLERLRAGTIDSFLEALRARIFTELGNGVLDLAGVLEALAARDYQGWLMVEQDTTWNPPSESAAIGRRVLEFALRLQAEGRTGA